MIFTYVTEDNTLIMQDFSGEVNLTTVPDEIHAIQGREGSKIEIEYKDGRHNKILSGPEAKEFLEPIYKEAQAKKAEVEAQEQQWLNSWEKLRQDRDLAIYNIMWVVERHNTEKDLGKETTLSHEDYIGVLEYIQELRDLPSKYSKFEPRRVQLPDINKFVSSSAKI